MLAGYFERERVHLTLRVTASSTPTLRSLDPYASSVPSSLLRRASVRELAQKQETLTHLTSNPVTGLSPSPLVFFSSQVLVSQSDTKDFFSPRPGLRVRTEGEQLMMV